MAADFTIAEGDNGLYNKSTVANTEIVIDITRSISQLEIRKFGGPALYYTTNGDEATVEGQDTFEIPANLTIADVLDIETTKGTTKTLRVISAGVVNFSLAIS